MSSDAWQLTILLLSGLRLMHSGKAWRPIVTVEVEAGEAGANALAGGVYETILGVDGQSVNQRESMLIYDVEPSAKVAINIWLRSQSKKKKRRVLVASASCCLSELAKKQENTDGKLDVRLTCRSSDKASSAARGRPQKGAVLRMKLRPPVLWQSKRLAPPPVATSDSTSTLRPDFINAVAGPSRRTTLESVYTEESSQVEDESTPSSIHEEDAREDGASSMASEDAENAWFGEGMNADHHDRRGFSESFHQENTSDPVTLEEPEPLQPEPQPQSGLRRRKRVKGFAIDTDDECASVSASEGYSDVEHEPLLPPSLHLDLKDDDGNSNTFVDIPSPPSSPSSSNGDVLPTPRPPNFTLSLKHTETIEMMDELVFQASTGDIISFSSTTTETGEKVWVAAARDVLLPMYTEKIPVPSADDDMLLVERMLATVTLYRELRRAAKTDSEKEYEPIMRRLQSEWAVVGTLLLALAGVNTAMFTIQEGGMFTITEHAAVAIALSSVTSGLGITCTAWFFIRFNWADIPTFIARSLDVFGTHFFFALSARVPALCMFLSACSLTVCLALIAYATFPGGVLVLCFLVGVLMSLQFIVYGVNWLGKQIVTGGRAGGKRVRGVVHRVRGTSVSGSPG